MANDKAGPLLNKLAQILARDSDYPLEGTLLHAEIDTGYSGIAIFRDLGDHLVYRETDYRLLEDVLFDLWELDPPGKRWWEIEYLIRDGRFDANFIYPDEVDRDEGVDERRDRLLAHYYGDKPVRYPPMPTGEELFELD